MMNIQGGLVDAAKFTPISIEPPDAWVGHLPFAAWLIKLTRPAIFVELGTHSGNSYFSFCQAVSEEGLPTKCYAVDTWQGEEHAGFYSEEVFCKVNSHNQEHYADFSRLLRMKFDEALSCFSDGTIDLLHIDGLHTYDAVKHDFETWRSKLTPGAIILFHDTNVRERGFGVWKLWEELQERYPNNLEFIHSHGLGVLQVDDVPEEKILEWLQPSSPIQKKLKDFFSALGTRQVERFELRQLRDSTHSLNQAVAERDVQIIGLNQEVADRDEQIVGLNSAVAKRDLQVLGLNQEVADRDEQIVGLNQVVAELDLLVFGLNQSVADRDEQIVGLSQAVADRDEQIVGLSQAVAERDVQIVRLNQAVAERDIQFFQVLSSNSLRITRPLRGLGHLTRLVLSKKFIVRNLYLLTYSQIKRYGLSGFSRRLPYYLNNSKNHLRLAASQPLTVDGGMFKATRSITRDIRLHPDLTPSSGMQIDESVSIVIPTLNAGVEFSWLLRKLRSQLGLGNIEIVIVDSGSKDDTVKIAREANCKVIEIAPEDFSHSYARNCGADAALGNYLLFMVQDAFPIGIYWAYGILKYIIEHKENGLVAASCAEYSRSDSDMMYNSMINTHYRFLGCLDYDRIGEYQGSDHMSLRAYGQLSDVSCLISREIFLKYRYRGDYAEDLDLGIRLIKDGHKVAMMASIKVIHSHNRSSYYYLKRSFVDVVFLVGMFDDFIYQRSKSQLGVIASIVSISALLSEWLTEFDLSGSTETLYDSLNKFINSWRTDFNKLSLGERSCLGDDNLDMYIESLSARYLSSSFNVENSDVRYETRRFLDAYLARLEHFNAFAKDVYGCQDSTLGQELREVIIKTFCATAGAALGFMYMESEGLDENQRNMADTIYKELKAGI